MTRSVALAAYLALSRAAGPLAPIILRYRRARGKEDPARLGERLGRPSRSRPPGRLIWFHAMSVGEAVSALPLIDALLARAEAHVLMTTRTPTSVRRLDRDLRADRAIHQLVPIDTRAAVSKFLDHWRPDLAVWIETDLWRSRLIGETARRDVPVALVNARLSARSAARWARVGGMARELFGTFRLILAQDEDSVARLAAFGAHARFVGNLKAGVEPPADSAELERLRRSLGERPIWLAASTERGEDEVVFEAQASLAARFPGTALILAPRHPERGAEIARLMEGAGLRGARRSTGQAFGEGSDVLLADTLGEMGLWYRLAAVTFVGGSLVDKAGHTPFEPAALGSAVVHGPHVANFAAAYRALAANDATLRISDGRSLADAVGRLLADDASRKAMAARGDAARERLRPDLDAIATDLLALPRPSP